MNIALDKNGVRIKPSPKARGTCQLCEEELIAHCGEIYTWHWQHRQEKDCDPWKEHETEWHRQWKNKFPEDWQEFAVVDDWGSKHLADVKTPAGLVIEFQNSSISTSTIKEREEFYGSLGDMIWVVNAKEFWHNFVKSSVVKRELRKLEIGYSQEINSIRYKFRNLREELKDKIQSKEEEISHARDQVLSHLKDLQPLEQSKGEIEALTKSMVTYWLEKSYDRYLGSISSSLPSEHKDQVLSMAHIIQETEGILNKTNSQLEFIKGKPEIEVEGKMLTIVRYSELSKENFSKAIVFQKDSLNSLFKIGSPIPSEHHLDLLKHQLDKVVIAMDLSKNVADLVQKKMETEDGLKLLEATGFIGPELGRDLGLILDQKINLLKQRIASLEIEIEIDSGVLSDFRSKLGNLANEEAKELDTATKQQRDERHSERGEIMNTYKGQYTYSWKNERTTWRSASYSVFFDAGDGNIFKRINSNLLLKCPVEDFIEYCFERRRQ